MQSKTFSRLSFLAAVIVTGFLMVHIAGQGASVVPIPDFLAAGTSTPAAASSTAQASVPSAIVVPPLVPSSVVKTPKGGIRVFVASTSEEREQGLSGQASLPKTNGLLFSFDTPSDYGFWMKDMLFPLDFVWISADKKVAAVDPGIPVDSYPQVFYPPRPIQYVLELNAGGAKQWGIATGTQLVF